MGRGAARGRGAAALSRSTHAGAVVFKLTDQGPRYLLVEASGRRDRWVFPKGHIENRETAADTAQREVGGRLPGLYGAPRKDPPARTGEDTSALQTQTNRLCPLLRDRQTPDLS